MSKNTSTTARLSAVESDVAVIKSDLGDLKAGIATLLAAKGLTTKAAPAKTPKAGKAKTTPAKTAKAPAKGTTANVIKVPVGQLRAALKAHKASGAIQSGLTVAQALEAGLMLGDGTLPGGKAKKGKGAKAAAAKPAKAPRTPEEIAAAEAKRQAQFEAFRGLQTALRAHKEAGVIRKGITVKEAIAEGLIDETGALLCEHGLAEVEVCAEVNAEATKAERKAAKKAAKKAKQAAALEVEAPARTKVTDVAPRRADGTITPKAEWSDREALAMSGQFDRHQIDAIIAQYRSEGHYA